jgi:hypothetical protein
MPPEQLLYTGSKPLATGINRRKRLAKKMDRDDRKLILAKLGSGFPKRHTAQTELVAERHKAYHG